MASPSVGDSGFSQLDENRASFYTPSRMAREIRDFPPIPDFVETKQYKELEQQLEEDFHSVVVVHGMYYIAGC